VNEASRFLRYVTPGLVFVLETVLLLWCFNPDWVESHLLATGNQNLGVAATAFLASGGIGYLLSVIHHELHWWRPHHPMDFREFVNDLRARRLIPPLDPTFQEGDHRSSDSARRRDAWERREAWMCVIVLWSERVPKSITQVADDRMNSLNDLFHGTGAALVGAWGALPMTILILERISVSGFAGWGDVGRALLGSLVVAMIIMYFHSTGRRTARNAKAFIERVLGNAIDIERQSKGEAPRDSVGANPPPHMADDCWSGVRRQGRRRSRAAWRIIIRLIRR
jgi:hypothetical protein